MAISLMFGVIISTLLTLLVIPLGCSSGRKAFLPVDTNNPVKEEVKESGGFISSFLQLNKGIFNET